MVNFLDDRLGRKPESGRQILQWEKAMSRLTIRYDNRGPEASIHSKEILFKLLLLNQR